MVLWLTRFPNNPKMSPACFCLYQSSSSSITTNHNTILPQKMQFFLSIFIQIFMQIIMFLHSNKIVAVVRRIIVQIT